MRFRSLLVLVLLSLAAPAAMTQDLRLPLVLSDGAVVQRGRDVPVWGWAAPGATVEVALGGARRSATADADGRWRTALPAMAAGGPHALTVTSGGDRVEAVDLLVGDVWVLSGQSNMEWTVRDADDAAAEIAAAGDPAIRHFKVPRSWAEAPADELAGGAWATASPETVGDFSAVGYFFARDLREHHDVPIGLVNTTWGGSRIEPWMSAEMLGYDADDVRGVWAAERAQEAATRAQLMASLGGELPTEDAGMAGGEPVWAAPDLDDADWRTVRVPALWESEGYPGLDGIAWYRTTFTLTPAEAAGGATLGLGPIDDGDVTWVNGVEVGRTPNAYSEERRYAVPAAALRAGANTLAVRVEDFTGGGGIYGAPDLVALETADGTRRPLAGDWRFKVGSVRIAAEGDKNHVPMGLWNRMVHPLTAQPVAGVLWYQGESNGDRMEDAVAYGGQFRTMIAGWREAWDEPGLPFFWVQLANFHAPPAGPADTGVWPTVREGQSSALALDHTAEAVILDVGDADDIHPTDKQTVGHRLALAARALVYGESGLVHSGPRYRGHEARDGRVEVAFDGVGGGLATRGGGDDVGGFAVAGADGVWHWADARVEDDRVVVWSEAVPSPVAVRYAWADNPEAADLVNAEGLPAAPFRTDGR